jgi:hypothetical protein
METKNDILNELASFSPLIAAMDKVNVYTVPQGYFDSISFTVLACLPHQQGLTPITANLKDAAVPEGYFDQLAAAIIDKIKADQSAKEEIRSLSPILSDLQRKQVFEVPTGYFDQLTTAIFDSTQNSSSKDELKKLSPVLNGIQSKNILEVPADYFAGLSNSILQKAKTPSASVTNSRVRTMFIRYAAAAILTGVIALGTLQYLGQQHPAQPLAAASVVLDESIEKGKNMNDQQFKEALEKLSKVDIAKYLEKNGDISDVAVLGNNMDDSNLPSQDDYLLDETALDNFLKKINANNRINN